MLYLTRKTGEEVIIDDKIQLRILEIRGNTVKIGFESPKEIKILRKELYERIKKENIEAAQSSALFTGSLKTKDSAGDANDTTTSTDTDSATTDDPAQKIIGS